MVMDLYSLVRDLIDEAKKQKNLELVDKLIDLKLAISEVQDENESLKKKLDIVNQVERHEDGNYITLKNDSLKIKYCSTCWGEEQKLIQLGHSFDDDERYPKCAICFNNWLRARNSGK